MLTLEKVRPEETKTLPRGTRLLCYINSYGFRENFGYRIFDNSNGDYIVKDRDGIQVIFESIKELKKVFYIMEE